MVRDLVEKNPSLTQPVVKIPEVRILKGISEIPETAPQGFSGSSTALRFVLPSRA